MKKKLNDKAKAWLIAMLTIGVFTTSFIWRTATEDVNSTVSFVWGWTLGLFMGGATIFFELERRRSE